ncbi:MAG: PfkB family carbohydrate kinase [Opitutales bacterium]
MSERISLDSAQPQPVLIVGSVAFDDIITPYATGERILGGSASYASLASSFYAPTQLVGVVGNDFDPKYRQRLEARGIDLDGLQIDSTGPTFFWKGQYHENFNRRDTLDLQLNVFETFQPELPERFRQTPFVMLGNIGPGLQMHVVDQLQGSGHFVVADTIDFWIDAERDALLEMIRKVDLFTINDDEATKLTGKTNLIDAGWALRALGPERAIVKKGEHGAYLFSEEGLFALPAFPVTELRDPTGAGDSFAGALLGYLAAVNRTDVAALKQAMVYATVTASLTVEAFSCDRLESAGVAELAQRRDQLLRMIQV